MITNQGFGVFAITFLACGVVLAAAQGAQGAELPITDKPSLAGDKIHPMLNRVAAESDDPLKVWVFFADKGVTTASDLNAAVVEVQASYNPRAVERRRLRGLSARAGRPLFDEHDLPVVQAYVDAVTSTGARIHITSKWVNAASAYATLEQIHAIAELPFVTKLQPVARSRRPEPMNVQEVEPGSDPRPDGGLRGLDYGSSFAQLNQINLIPLHEQGYTGEGVIVGILDTGFQRSHVAFNNIENPLRVIAEYDFVDDDGDTSSEPGDPFGQHNHGTLILGVLGAYMPGALVGGAYDASFVLAKTEDTTGEYPAEEDNYVAGLEFLESHGVDMSTASLGYLDWYTQADMDGMTAVTTIAINIYTSHGIHHCNAAGNEYHDSDPTTSSLIAPSDGFDVITCGAVNSSGSIAFFSSEGPTADGRVKPEVLARGVGTHTVSPSSDTGYTTADGTSLSTPVVACAVACITQAKPHWTVEQMRQHLFETADYVVEHETFDPLYIRGYGIIDAEEANAEPLAILLPEGVPSRIVPGRSTAIRVDVQGGDESILPDSPTLHYRLADGAFVSSPMTWVFGDVYEATLPPARCADEPEFYFSAEGHLGSMAYSPPDAPDNTYTADVAIYTSVLADDFESAGGWTVVNEDLVDGAWQRGVPVGDGSRGDPLSDYDGSGQCYVTANRAGNADVDGGPTRLVSPALDVAGLPDPVLQYARWFYNDDLDSDRLQVELSADSGANWVLVESVTGVTGGGRWVDRAVRLADYITLATDVRVRFSVWDNPNNSITEAAVDGVHVFDLTCLDAGTGDFDGNGEVDFRDFARFQVCFDKNPMPGLCLPGDMNGIGDTIDLDDFALFAQELDN
jgi:hypothetical protein